MLVHDAAAVQTWSQTAASSLSWFENWADQVTAGWGQPAGVGKIVPHEVRRPS